MVDWVTESADQGSSFLGVTSCPHVSPALLSGLFPSGKDPFLHARLSPPNIALCSQELPGSVSHFRGALKRLSLSEKTHVERL